MQIQAPRTCPELGTPCFSLERQLRVSERRSVGAQHHKMLLKQEPCLEVIQGGVFPRNHERLF